MDKQLLKLLNKVRDYKDVEPVIFSFYPNYKNDYSFKMALSLLKKDNFDFITFRQKIIGQYSIYSDVSMKTANELKLKKIKVTPTVFNHYFRANWVYAILNDNIATLFADPFLPTITFYSLEKYIKEIKKGKLVSNKKLKS